MSFATIELDVVRWAEARRIIPNAKPSTQLLKLVSEVGELCDADIKGDMPGIVDGVGDVATVLIIYCSLMDINLTDCLKSAYEEIKDRKGTLLPNGVFRKDT